MEFKEIDFVPVLQDGLESMGFRELTPVQEQTIPSILKGKDIIGCAQTGTGKTAAFVLPVLNALHKKSGNGKVRAMIVVPTRELAQQVDRQIEGFSYFTEVSSISIYGGRDGSEFAQEKQALMEGADIVVCTPGRMIAHINLDYFDASQVEFFILDEADRMLDMGFVSDILRIASIMPKTRQTLLFSATMPPKIMSLARGMLKQPDIINIAISRPPDSIKQGAYMVYDEDKPDLIYKLLISRSEDHILIFSSTILGVKQVNKTLNKHGVKSREIHSELEQKEREEVLREFRNKTTKILVATDVLSRGIDIKGIDLVINYDVPQDAEDYVHRIGRTARGESHGEAITLLNKEQCTRFANIEFLIGKEVEKMKLPEGIKEGPVYSPEKLKMGENKKYGSKGKGGKFHNRKGKNHSKRRAQGGGK